jgi:hypothetical protein
MIRCLSCGAETSNGLALCELCQHYARTTLAILPTYYRNLARWSPGRAGSRRVPGSREPAGLAPSRGDRVGRALDAAANALTTRARELADDRPHLARLLDRLAAAELDDERVIAWLCKGFDRHLTSLSTLDWCGDFVADLATHETTLRALTEQVVPGWYAGGCKRCDAGTYVVPGLTWVTCGGCGATTYARDHLDTVLDEARNWVARPKALAEAIVALVDTEASVPRLYDRIRQWSSREQIEAVRRYDERGRPVGVKRYHLGDVLDLLLTEGTTRREGARRIA